MTTLSGFLVIDKPFGMTSRDVVNRAIGWFPRGTRVGHTGTLDPLATGVLVLAVGNGTRFTEHVQQMEKVYRAGIRLGGRSTTDDAEGDITPGNVDTPPDLGTIERALQIFVGAIEQTPPAFSAAKITGRRAYDLARRGRTVELAPRTVQVYEIRLLGYTWPDLHVEVRCGKGTYIRSLARDLGDMLGCGGYIQSLRRTRVGPFDEAAALTLEDDPATARTALLDLAWSVGAMTRLNLGEVEAKRFRHGQRIPLVTMETLGVVAVFDHEGTFAGVGRVDAERILHPETVIR